MSDDELMPHEIDTAESWVGGPYWCLCGALMNRNSDHRNITVREATR